MRAYQSSGILWIEKRMPGNLLLVVRLWQLFKLETFECLPKGYLIISRT